MIKSFLRDETGLELSEYAVAAALVALAVVGVFTTLGDDIKDRIDFLSSKIANKEKKKRLSKSGSIFFDGVLKPNDPTFCT